MGFKTYPHVQLNVSWGNIISDIDLIVESEGKLFGIEIKSRKDNLRSLLQQIDRMSDFFDGIYVATDKPTWKSRKELSDERIGLLIIENGQISEKPCQFLSKKPRSSAMMLLRKICLSRISITLNGKSTSDKLGLVSEILNNMSNEQLRLALKSIVTCERKCKTDCPLWVIEKHWIMPLRNVQSFLEKYHIQEGSPVPLVPAEFKEKSEDVHRQTNRVHPNEKQPRLHDIDQQRRL